MKKALIVGTVFPEPKSSAAGTKMMQWLELFLSNDFAITYASTSSSGGFSADISGYVVQKMVVKVNDTSFDTFVQDLQPTVVLYDRFMTEEQFSWRVRAASPQTVHLLETQDLHFLREAREKNISFFSTTAKRELAAILRCDLSFLISEFEMQLLHHNFPFVSDKIHYFPLCYKRNTSWKLGTHQRTGFCFIGNFLHAPNRDAVLFLKKIWKEIRNKIPTAKLHIYGAYPSQQILQLHQEKEGFLVHGRAKSVKDVFLQHKVLLAPISFGAGLKGKLLESMQYGIASVTTPLGAEGISTYPKWNGEITNLDTFAESAIAVYNTEENYSDYQQIGINILEDKFDASLFVPEIRAKINSLIQNISNWREHHFLSEIMNYHRQQSVRYLSKWIEEKNKL